MACVSQREELQRVREQASHTQKGSNWEGKRKQLVRQVEPFVLNVMPSDGAEERLVEYILPRNPLILQARL